jgi:hypothetical protein
MGLKKIIKQQKLLQANAINAEFTIPGEPLIYSIKYPVGQRSRYACFFRNEKFRSLFKCFFNSYLYTNTPVVVIVKFYVTPFQKAKLRSGDLKRENVPATFAYELCDYILSFQEMLFHVLINSYRQIVKLDAEKYYSSNPRTVFKFMKWDHYVNLQNNNSLHTEG